MKSFLRIKNKNTIIFIISIGISAVMWLLIKLSKEYEIIVKIPVEYVNLPSDKVIVKTADSLLKVSLTDNGFDLIGSKITATSNPIILNVERFRAQKLEQGKTKLFVLSNTFYEQIKTKFGSSTKISNIKPDSLVLTFEKLASKEVFVYHNIEAKLAAQYQFAEAIALSPNSIMIYGTAKQLNQIDSIHTIYKEYKNLDKDIDEEIAINLPENIRVESNHVQVKIDIEKFTEASLNVPIQTNFDKSKQIKVFPNHVQIKFAISLDNYHLLNADQFTIIGKDDSLSVGKLNIFLTKFPEHIRVIDYSPKMAEFIIIK